MQVLIPERSISLAPGEQRTEELRLVPRAPGWMRILGASWVLASAAVGAAAFGSEGQAAGQQAGGRKGSK
jgi:hypothetical protein